MSTIYQIATPEPAVSPAERFNRLGQTLGLWKLDFDFLRSCRQVFRNTNFKGKSMLEIGCGKGILCLWAALHGAREVVGIDPLATKAYDDVPRGTDFQSLANHLELSQAKLLPCTFQQYECPKENFDIIVSVASIHLLDAKSCVRLRESPLAVMAYEKIFRRIANLMKPGGKFIVMDSARKNVFGDLGFRNPLCPETEWSAHQQPEYWVELLQGCGFEKPRIRWASADSLRHLGIAFVPQAISYLSDSVFHLEMTRTIALRCR